MLCPICQVEMRITNTKNVAEHDDTPDEETKLFVVQELSCVNRECSNYNKVVETIKNELTLS